MKFTPASTAAFSAAIDSLSSTGPHEPPIAQAPKLISETFQPVRPNGRYRIFLIVTNSEVKSGYVTECGHRPVSDTGPNQVRTRVRSQTAPVRCRTWGVVKR